MPSYGSSGGNTSNAQKTIDANNAKYQAEAQAYANSKGISIPSDFSVMSSMVVLPTSSYYKAVRDVERKRDTARDREYASKTPQYAVDQYINNKNQFFQTLIGEQAKKAIFQKNLPIMGQDLQKYIKYAASAGVPASIVNTAIKQEQDAARGSSGGGLSGFFNDVFGGVGDIVTSAYQSVSNTLAKAEDVVKEDVLTSPIFQIAMAYYMPGISSSFASSLGTLGVSATYQAAVANAIVSITVQVAQGVPLEKAIETATINAIVSTGSPKVATELNNVIKSPAITDAIVSAGSSAAKTALNGGSQSDIERNLIGGLLGSATASTTGSTVAGSTVGGGVTGGVLGALSGAASAIGANEVKDKTKTTTDAGTSADPGIKVAGGDDASALNMASISAKPEMLGKSGETASALTSRVDEGVTIYERTITGKTPDGKEYSYTATYDPSAPSDKQISYTSSGVVKDAQGNVIPTAGGSAVASFTRPDFTAAATTGTYTPTIITPDGTISTGGAGGTTGTGAVSTPVTPTPVSPDQPILDLIAPTLPITEPVKPVTPVEPTPVTPVTPTPVIPTPTPVEPVIPTPVSPVPVTPSPVTPVTPAPITPIPPAPTTPITEPITPTGPVSDREVMDVIQPPVDVPSIPSLPTTTVTEPKEPEIPEVPEIPEEPTTPEETTPVEELPPVEDITGKPVPYKPTIYTYGGTSPSTLSQTLGTTLASSTTTGTSVGLGGRGEVESKESGKKRKNVWNEESLRLKDALGL